MSTMQLQAHRPGPFSGATRRALPSSCFNFWRRATAGVSRQSTGNVLPDSTCKRPARTHPCWPHHRLVLAASTANDVSEAATPQAAKSVHNWMTDGNRDFKVKVTMSYTVKGLCRLDVTETLDPTAKEEGTPAVNAAMLASFSNLESKRRCALARALNYVAKHHADALDVAAIYGRLSQPLAAGSKLDEKKPPVDLMKAVRFEELYCLCELLAPSMSGTIDYEILAKLGQMEQEAQEILRKRREKEAEGAAALAEAAGSSGAEAGSLSADAAGSSSGSLGESSSNGASSGSSSNGSGGAAGASPAGAAASSAAGGVGRLREAAAGSSSAPAGGDQPEEYTPETAALRMVNHKDMAVWKRAMRTAIYQWARLQPEPVEAPQPRFTFTLNDITPDEQPLVQSTLVELEGPGSEDFMSQMELAYVGSGTPGGKALAQFWRDGWGGLGGMNFIDGPEEAGVKGLLERALLTVQLPGGGQTFECTIFSDVEPQPASRARAATGSTDDTSKLCSFSGTREELLTVCFALAWLEGDIQFAAGTQGWFPRDFHIVFQRQGVAGRDARYGLRVYAVGQSPESHQQPPEVDVELSSKQFWALADCLDSFYAAHPQAAPNKAEAARKDKAGT